MLHPDDAVVLEIPYRDPVVAFQPLASQPFAQLLVCAPPAPAGAHVAGVPAPVGGGRYSFIVADPCDTLIARGGRIETAGGGAATGTPFEALRARLKATPLPSVPGYPPFQGGAVGFFGYELHHHLETIRPSVRQDASVPDMAFGFYECVAVFDQARQKAFVLSWPLTGTRAQAETRARALAARLGRGGLSVPEYAPAPPPRSNLSRAAYEAAVARVIEHIFDGDIYQANVSQSFSSQVASPDHAFDLFRRLHALSPVPYGAYMTFPGLVLASNSPERFVRLSHPQSQRLVETRPIKGTAPRGGDPAQDAARARALLRSEKDRAENVMIVDLLRNDLSKVCEDESVLVTGLCEVESYTAIHHLVSTVVGVLRPGCDAVDLVTACFPGGSITGAPKVRAMEIIAQEEGSARGAYCGAIGYLGFDGSMDTSIAIRTLSFTPVSGEEALDLSFRVGGGITARSTPAAEYQESLDKAAAFFRALTAPPETLPECSLFR